MTRLVILALALLATPAGAQPAGDPPGEEAPMVVGVYAPRAYFANSPARTQQAQAIAKALEAATGKPFKGRGFSSRGEFTSQIAAGALQFAVIEAQHQVESGLKPLAQARAGGAPSRPMALVVGGAVSAQSVGDLKGKRLTRVSVGKGDKAFVLNLLLSGEIGAQFFGKGRTVRDAQGALTLAKLGKADAAFTFAGLTGGLREIYRSRPVPLPVFVQTDTALPADLVAKVRGAVSGLTVPGGTAYDSFGPDAPASRKALAGALKRSIGGPSGKAILAPVTATLPKVPVRLDAQLPSAPPGPAATSMGVPALPEDRF